LEGRDDSITLVVIALRTQVKIGWFNPDTRHQAPRVIMAEAGRAQGAEHTPASTKKTIPTGGIRNSGPTEL